VRNQAASERQDRSEILAEFVRITGYHRKHAIPVLNHSSASPIPRRRERARLIRDALSTMIVGLDTKRFRRVEPVGSKLAAFVRSKNLGHFGVVLEARSS
jgi:hypothetical protein